MTGHGLKICRDVRVDSKSHIKEDDLSNRREGLESFRFISLEIILESRVDECEITTVGAQIQLRRHSDPLVRGSDAQAVTYVIEIVGAGEYPQKVAVLQFLDTCECRLVREERSAFRLTHDQFVQALGDLVRPPLGKRLQRSESLEVFVGQLKKRESPLEFFIVELQDVHVVWLLYLFHCLPRAPGRLPVVPESE